MDAALTAHQPQRAAVKTRIVEGPMTLLISTSLITVWMFSVVLGTTLGGLVHVLPLASAMTVIFRGNAPHR